MHSAISYYEVTLLLIKMNTLYIHFYMMDYNNLIQIFLPDPFILSLADRHCLRLLSFVYLTQIQHNCFFNFLELESFMV